MCGVRGVGVDGINTTCGGWFPWCPSHHVYRWLLITIRLLGHGSTLNVPRGLPPIYSQVLVEKEWCSFGHKFAQRCGHHEGKTYTDKQRSPVFVQWLDCVWQLLHQFPNEFGFNALILSVLFEQVRKGSVKRCK